MNENDFVTTDSLGKLNARVEATLAKEQFYIPCGRITNVSGLVIEVSGLSLAIGQVCKILVSQDACVLGEVIGFNGSNTLIMPYDNTVGIAGGMLVVHVPSSGLAPVSDSLLGRVVDAFGVPIDELGNIDYQAYYPLHPKPVNPLKRMRISQPLDVGVRAINMLTTICRGQRMGIFAASGLGKSVLLGMMTKFSHADVVIVGLVGERGREVKEFIEDILGEQGLKKSVIVAVSSDSSPLLKVAGATYATSIAEYFRDQNKNVLLILDSLTRYAQACREITLSAGEMPATKGYTPSVFAKLSQLVERSGNGLTAESAITAIYTVLVEDTELNDPISEHIRSLLDGHIVLSRTLAEDGHYPAIDVDKSISRVMHSIVSPEQYQSAILLKQVINAYQKSKDMINIGMYHAGSDKRVDLAIKLWNDIRNFLTQPMQENSSMEQDLQKLNELMDKFKGQV